MARTSGVGVAFTILRFCLSTIPFFAVLVYLLYVAAQRGNFFDEDDGGLDDLFSLLDTSIVFLAFHVVWTVYAVYLLVFVPKRRYLLDRYLREGERTLGDVIVEDPSKKTGLRRCLASRQYGYAIYSHPTKTDPPVVVRKKVRVYQPYTRERVEILRLPNRPLSGQAKTDIEIDLSKMRAERDTTLCYISGFAVFWVVFSLAGAAFCVYKTSAIDEDYLVGNENAGVARRILFIVAGVNPVFAFFANGLRFLMYYNWMIHWGASMDNEESARKIKAGAWCLYNNGDEDEASFDGSDQIPYSILGEDKSYAGTVPSHSQPPPVASNNTDANPRAKTKTMTVSSEDGTTLKALPWTGV
mmetsp:Transcript_23098/g.51424  ORF Transcript_23098/g.51424 Transcript_23098/m.51424 type:complete len:356 (+) Transcript_23098:323-1390(+)|eukprot:CAMPEP_0201126318 /NCGR_PEP_ID=MMETSP0850-20130426/25653_1 /ASSEMBLY_ACC=CAM_ASM_000622 /TAXON_ID=183588 /ORGANISM="Pseudo-nitzschia fraudulenta, Strain WWA7" /LENGTH=355 /DNA_ID=CAMNT_0047394711 /DNA_START=265 /DNA_END=1332 /DNA_ORIENTATION=-